MLRATILQVYWNRLIDIAYRIQEYLLSESVGWDGVTNQVEIDRSLALSMLGQLVSHTEHCMYFQICEFD